MTKEQALKILELKSTHTLKEVATTLNLSVSTVRYWLRNAKAQGLTTPPPQKAGRKPLSLK